MQERIKFVRKHFKLTQVEFGERIGVKGNTITGYENGIRTASDAVIKSICREFGCNEVWLRTGKEEPFKEESRTKQIMRFASEVCTGSDEFKKAFVSMLAQLDANDWERLTTLFQRVSDGMKKE